MTIQDGAEAYFSRFGIGNLSSADLFVTGEGSLVSVGELFVMGESSFDASESNIDAKSMVFISEGGKMVTGEDELGIGTTIGATSQAHVVVDGLEGGEQAMFEARDAVFLGGGGGRVPPEFDGKIEILNGGLFKATHVYVPSSDEGSALLVLQGESEAREDRSTAQISKTLSVGGISFDSGGEGAGEVEVLDGAELMVGEEIIVGNFVQGSIIVDGWSPSNSDQKSKAVTPDLLVGRDASGLVVVSNGGLMEVQIGISLGGPNAGKLVRINL